jgi:hypothetical protein
MVKWVQKDPETPHCNRRLLRQGSRWLFTPWEGFTCIILSPDGGTHGDIARANESEAGSGAPRTTEFHNWGE